MQKQVCVHDAATIPLSADNLSRLREKMVPLYWRPQEDMHSMSMTKAQSEMVCPIPVLPDKHVELLDQGATFRCSLGPKAQIWPLLWPPLYIAAMVLLMETSNPPFFSSRPSVLCDIECHQSRKLSAVLEPVAGNEDLLPVRDQCHTRIWGQPGMPIIMSSLKHHTPHKINTFRLVWSWCKSVDP